MNGLGSRATLSAALDVLLPGNSIFPAASAVGLAGRLVDHPALAEPALTAIGLLGEGFADRPPIERIAAVAALERAQPAVFARFVVAAYSGYYSTPEVLQAVERDSGYAARPPQPHGYALPPFDPDLLAVPAARPPSYRTVPDRS